MSRMLEDAGISFFFEDSDGTTTMVLDDNPQAREMAHPGVPYYDQPGSTSKSFVTQVTLTQRTRPGRVTIGDLDYRRGSMQQPRLSAAAGLAQESRLEHFEYEPGAFLYQGTFGGNTPKDTFHYGAAERRKTYEDLNANARDPDVDYVMLGCPHAALEQIEEACRLLAGRRISANTRLWIFTSRAVKRAATSDRWFEPLHVQDPVAARDRIAAQIAAGADVVLAPTWRTHRRALMEVGESRRAPAWTLAAVDVAREGVDAGLERRAQDGSPDAPDREGTDAPPPAIDRPAPLVAAMPRPVPTCGRPAPAPPLPRTPPARPASLRAVRRRAWTSPPLAGAALAPAALAGRSG